MAGLTIEQKVEIIEALEKGEPVWRIARRMAIQPRTIRKWRQRASAAGRAGLESKMGRPSKGALSSYEPAIGEALRQWRQTHPGWGATTLLTELTDHEAFQGQRLPSRSAIARFLNEEGLVEASAPRVLLPNSSPLKAKHPHQIWEMDARGYERIADVGMVSLIDLNDRFSHARLLSYPCYLGRNRVERHAETADYQAALRTAFMQWGLPEMLQVDHESVFYDNRTRSPFPTCFHLWLVALGIPLTFIPVHQPTAQGMTERSHQLWYHQVLQGQTFPDWAALFEALRKRCFVLNHRLPCHATGDQPPLVAYPDARHSDRPYQLLHEPEMLSLQRVYDYLAQGRWFRFVSQNGTLSLGGSIYYLGAQWHKQQAEITFQPTEKSLSFHDDSGRLITTKPIQGLSIATLMGDISDFSRLPPFQLTLPFSWPEQRSARLFETIS